MLMYKTALGFSPERTSSGRREIMGNVTFLDCARPSHAFQVGHPLNATNDPQLSCDYPDRPPGFPECPWGGPTPI